MATHALASWATKLRFEDLPPAVVTAARQSFYNWAGCAVGGSQHPTTLAAVGATQPFFGAARCSLLGSPLRADAQHAALVNGVASHVHDYDDTHLETIIHPTGPVASALLAYAEWARHDSGGEDTSPTTPPPPSSAAAMGAVSGRAFLTALVAGIEAECKCGLAVWPAHYDVGWHITSSTGSIGAAVAVGKLMGLPAARLQHAVGLAATQVTGLREMFGSDTKSFHAGRAAQNGLLAAVLAARGYTSSPAALEAKRGWANVVCPGHGDMAPRLDEQMAGLGTVWEVQKNSFKPFPCGIVIHPVIDGCVQLKQELDAEGVGPEEIGSVDAAVHPLVLELTGKKAPRDGLEAKFSVYHGAAIGLVLGKGTPAQYEDEVVLDPRIVGVRDRITATADDRCRADETRIVVTLRDGRKFERHVLHAVGSLVKPLTDDLLRDKFIDQAAKVLGKEAAAVASEALLGLETAEDVGTIAQQHLTTK